MPLDQAGLHGLNGHNGPNGHHHDGQFAHQGFTDNVHHPPPTISIPGLPPPQSPLQPTDNLYRFSSPQPPTHIQGHEPPQHPFGPPGAHLLSPSIPTHSTDSASTVQQFPYPPNHTPTAAPAPSSHPAPPPLTRHSSGTTPSTPGIMPAPPGMYPPRIIAHNQRTTSSSNISSNMSTVSDVSSASADGWAQPQQMYQQQIRGGQVQQAPPRRPSDAEEVEAGLALAGLGLVVDSDVKPTLQQQQQPQASTSQQHKPLQPRPPQREGDGPTKRAKKDDGKATKDMRKSCSECRRLKAKCDRVFPCSNCRRRGCALVCPDGDLSCMQGKRLVLASTEQLHDRIAQLEAALFQAHGKTDAGTHPLLAPKYLDGGFASVDDAPPLGNGGIRDLSPKTNELREEMAGRRSSSGTSFTIATPNLSTLSTSQRMAVETLLLSEDAVQTRENEWVSDNSTPALLLNRTTPDHADDKHAIAARLRKILAILPPRQETRRRATQFWQQCTWYQSLLRQDEFDRIYEPAVYEPTPDNPLSPHKLAVVFMVLVLDSFFDLQRDTEDPKVADYWDAAQRCLDSRFGWAASVPAVQAHGLAALFVGFGWKGARASNFYWLRQMTTTIQQLGMHKEPHPSVPPQEADIRRRVFWESFVIDCLISINHGQRTAIPLENIETRYPASPLPMDSARYEYMRRVMYSVIDIGLRPDANPAVPEQIYAVEEEMVKFDVNNIPAVHCPAMTGTPMPEPLEDLTTIDVMPIAKTAASMVMYKSSLFLYRPALRRLIGRLRTNKDSGFTAFDNHIVTSSFETCRCIDASAKYITRMQPRVAGRTWTTWVQLFSSAVTIAAIAIWCGPNMDDSFINQAFFELNEIQLIINESGSARAKGVHNLVPVLQTMLANRFPQVVGGDPSRSQINAEAHDMLYALLGGAVDAHGPVNLALEADPMAPHSNAPFQSLQPQHQQQPQAKHRPQRLQRYQPQPPAQHQQQQQQQHQQQHQQPQQHQGQHQAQHQQPPQPQRLNSMHATSIGSSSAHQSPINTSPPSLLATEWSSTASHSSSPALQQRGSYDIGMPQDQQQQQYNVSGVTVNVNSASPVNSVSNVQNDPNVGYSTMNNLNGMDNNQGVPNPALMVPGFMNLGMDNGGSGTITPNAPTYSLQPFPIEPLQPQVAANMLPSEEDLMSSSELWDRLQTFYEPIVWWGLGDRFDNGFRAPDGDGTVPCVMPDPPFPGGLMGVQGVQHVQNQQQW